MRPVASGPVVDAGAVVGEGVVDVAEPSEDPLHAARTTAAATATDATVDRRRSRVGTRRDDMAGTDQVAAKPR
jgi:hypothetical protein